MAHKNAPTCPACGTPTYPLGELGRTAVAALCTSCWGAGRRRCFDVTCLALAAPGRAFCAPCGEERDRHAAEIRQAQAQVASVARAITSVCREGDR